MARLDFRSDTITKPTKAMYDEMISAELGDDVLGDEPTVAKLEKFISEMFGMESALFCPSGTMTNQIAIKCHTQPGDEVICDKLSHIYNYEGGGIAFNSAASVRLIDGDNGRITSEQILKNINPDDIHFPESTLVSLENTCNKGGGCYYDFNEIKRIRTLCNEYNLKLHLDGARLFNALVETERNPKEYGNVFDSISICLSKGLGAPVGSLLLGNKQFIDKGRRLRKVFGGGMRQSGILAAAGLYALKNNIIRLKDEHKLAKEISSFLPKLKYVKSIKPVYTNIIIFELEDSIDVPKFLRYCEKNNVYLIGMGQQLIRIVTHMDVNELMLNQLKDTLEKIYLKKIMNK